MGENSDENRIQQLKVVLASPSDVFPERVIAQKAFERVNELYARLKRPYRLSLVDHTKTVPDSGNPQKVVEEHLKIEQSDFFVCLLGYRFGSPPGTRRPEDNSLYLSGTEEEFDIAYKANAQSSRHRPRIMVYRKKDPLPEKTSEDDVRQFARVLDFFDQCSSYGKHPAYVKEFTPETLEDILIEDFLQAAEEMETKGQSDKSNDWYENVGLRENPFSKELIGKEFQEEYTIPFAGIDWQQYRSLMESIYPIYIFGERGSGKSTLREMVKVKAGKEKQDGKILVCSLRAGLFDQFIDRAGGGLADFKAWVLAYMIFDKAVNHMVVGNSKVSSQPGLADVTQPARTLEDLMGWLRSYTDCRRVLVLVDELDEIKLVRESKDPDHTMVELLSQMLLLPQNDDISLRYFLPAQLEPLMLQQLDRFRLDKYKSIRLIWNEEKLLDLIKQRMSAASISKGHHTSISQIYNGSIGIKSIDMELVRLAEANPRALLWLANRLIEVHLLETGIREVIQPSSWEKVKFEWQNERFKFFPPKIVVRPFELRENGMWFKDKELRLSRRHTPIMTHLIQHYGAFCARERLKAVGWPDYQTYPVSDKNFDETMRHLKKEIEEFAPNWLTSVRGQGYKLEEPPSEKDPKEGKIL